jgi:ABC-2 type transport system permease protein
MSVFTMDDLKAVVWKETKSLFKFQENRSRYLFLILTPVLLGLVFPWTWGPDWVTDIPTMILAFFTPVLIIGVTITDSFAGERERHTLETLLASRLPDRAIFFGKYGFSVAVGWGISLVFLFLSLVMANIAHGHGQILLYTPTVALADLALSFLAATLTAGLGILVSLRSATAQQAAQTLMFILLLPVILLQVAAVILKDQLNTILPRLDGQTILVAILIVLAILDVLAFWMAASRFQRARLVF